MGGAVISPGFVFDLGLLSADRWGRIFPKWPPLEEHMPVSTPETFASSVLPQQWSTVTPCFPRRSSKNCSQACPRFPWSLYFVWDPVEMKACVYLSRMGFLSPPVPWSFSTEALLPSMPDALGALSPNAIPPGMGIQCGTQNSRSCRWVSVTQFLSSLCAAHMMLMGLCISHNRPSYHLDVVSSLFLGVGYLFWKFPIHFVEGCSAFGGNFVVLKRAGELHSFCPAILIQSPSPHFSTGFCLFVCFVFAVALYKLFVCFGN